MTKFRKSLLRRPSRTTRVHFQYQRGYCLFKCLLSVDFRHGVYM